MCVYDASLVANGPVTICELNLEFVKRLFEVDHVSFFQSFSFFIITHQIMDDLITIDSCT